MINAGNQVIIHWAEEGKWLYFQNPVEVFCAANPEEVVSILNHIEKEVERRKIYAAGFASYEAGAAFDPAFKFKAADFPPVADASAEQAARTLPGEHIPRRRPDLFAGSGFPLLWFGLFKKAEIFDIPAAPSGSLWSPDWHGSVTEKEYKAAIDKIRLFIAAGATYQVNYSFRLRAPFNGNARPLFFRLVAGRDIPYAAFIETEQFAVCSLSPELFFSLDGRDISSRPMKGTLPRGFLQNDDELNSRRLYNSEKNRAENVMIVDMVRNDLGRIAVAGTVQVASLFDIEKHDTVWQMTSTVRAETHALLFRIFQALFPPASITGAPKVNTMRIISELETSPRRIYTGSIGFLAPGRRAQFNVAIRTLLIDKICGEAEYGVGGGIVWDSIDEAEYRECILKAKILQEQCGEFSLLETMLWTPEENSPAGKPGYFLLDFHLERLKSSANYFSFKYDEAAVRAKLALLAGAFPAQQHRVRLLLARGGGISCEVKRYDSGRKARLLTVCLAKRNIASDNPFLYHKTTNRIVYESAKALCPGYDEVVLWNEKGEVTEFCAANIVVSLDGEMLTPPVKCGLLPGTFRAWLLKKGKVREQVIEVGRLRQCQRIYLCNSVRKMQEVKLADVIVPGL